MSNQDKLAAALAALPWIRERCEKAHNLPMPMLEIRQSYLSDLPLLIKAVEVALDRNAYLERVLKFWRDPKHCEECGGGGYNGDTPCYACKQTGHDRTCDCRICEHGNEVRRLGDQIEAQRERIEELERQKFINNIVAIGVENGERIDREAYLKALAEIEAQRERIAALEQALEFYADPDTYDQVDFLGACALSTDMDEDERELGVRARAALKQGAAGRQE